MRGIDGHRGQQRVRLEVGGVGVAVQRVEVVPHPDAVDAGASAALQASRIAATVVACGWSCTPIFIGRNAIGGRAQTGTGSSSSSAERFVDRGALDVDPGEDLVEPLRDPPVLVAEQFHRRRDEDKPDDRCIDQHGDRHPNPNSLSARSGPSPNAPNTQTMIAAAAVITRAVRARPSATASALFPVRSPLHKPDQRRHE